MNLKVLPTSQKLSLEMSIIEPSMEPDIAAALSYTQCGGPGMIHEPK